MFGGCPVRPMYHEMTLCQSFFDVTGVMLFALGGCGLVTAILWRCQIRKGKPIYSDGSGERMISIVCKWGVVASLPLLLVGATLNFFYQARDWPFVNPHIKAEAFVWPRGCPKGVHGGIGNMPRACILEKNPIPKWWRYGFKTVGRIPSPYYRVGNSAVEVECPKNLANDSCAEYLGYPDIYYQ